VPAALPFFLQHGTRDLIVPFQQSINFAAKLEQALEGQGQTGIAGRR
jgi:acetyl esterase/lipase